MLYDLCRSSCWDFVLNSPYILSLRQIHTSNASFGAHSNCDKYSHLRKYGQFDKHVQRENSLRFEYRELVITLR